MVQIQLSDTDLMSHLTQDSQPTPGQGQMRGESMSDLDENVEQIGSGTDGETSDQEALDQDSDQNYRCR